MTTNELFEKLDSFKELPPGWDTYEGLPAFPRSVELAKRIILTLEGVVGLPAFVSPVADGGVEIAWTNDVELCVPGMYGPVQTTEAVTNDD